MQNKKRMITIVLVLVMVMLTACTSDTPASNTKAEKVFKIEDYNISFSFPNNWKKEMDGAPYDLQCSNEESYACIFTYHKIDLSEGQTPLDIFNIQNDDIFSRRENVKKISEEKVDEFENKRIHSVLYSAENGGVKNYYYCNLIEFKEEADVFAWIIFTAVPSYSDAHIDEFKAITASANWTKE